ncbi:Holliday junction resolvase [Candidatus Woesearchaeota archaeon]|nr:Holliday junction resolvase [Candidatus Woesearchaeota archaeon]
MKAKGSNAERELVSMFAGIGWGAIRVAGSGSSKFPSPDVLVSNGNKVLAIECKSTKKKYQYFNPLQIRQLHEFASLFNAEPWLAIKFSTDWKFFKPNDLSKKKKSFGVTHNHRDAKFFADLTRN